MKIECPVNLWDTHAPRTMADMAKVHELEIEDKDYEIDELNSEISDLEDDIEEKQDEISQLESENLNADGFEWFERAIRDAIKTLDPLDDLAILLTRGVNDMFGE